jgi:hypothetical protein
MGRMEEHNMGGHAEAHEVYSGLPFDHLAKLNHKMDINVTITARFSQEIADFIRKQGSSVLAEDGLYFNLPVWYKETEDPLVFEEHYDYRAFPEYLKEFIRKQREKEYLLDYLTDQEKLT